VLITTPSSFATSAGSFRMVRIVSDEARLRELLAPPPSRWRRSTSHRIVMSSLATPCEVVAAAAGDADRP
jgi:hypothetical protein